MFDLIPSHYLIIASTVGAIFMGSLVMLIRVRSQNRPVNEKKIIIPPIAMSSGSLMFIFEEFRVTPLQIAEAAFVGLLFSLILIATSKFEIKNDQIYMKQSKAFFFILIGLLIIRIVGKLVLSGTFDVGELAGMFWILGFAMLWPWRLSMLLKFKKLQKSQLFTINERG